MSSKKKTIAKPKIIAEPEALYLHVPFCETKCHYCGFYSKLCRDYDTAGYIDALIADVAGFDFKTKPKTVYIGGGSPSSLAGDDLVRLVCEAAKIAENGCEFTVEFNPGQVTLELFKRLKDKGVNRISIGAQSFDDKLLKFLNRGHKSSQIKRAVELAKKAGFENVSIDLIFAVIGQSIKTWQKTITKAIELDVTHISAYALSFDRPSVFYQKMAEGLIGKIDEKTDREMYLMAIEMLTKEGFLQYEISNFAKKGFKCHHNVTYWKNKPYIGFGPSAGSYLDKYRCNNDSDVEGYIAAVKNGKNPPRKCQTYSKIEIACQQAILNLRMVEGIDINQYEIDTGCDIMRLFGQSIQNHIRNGLMEVVSGRLRLTPKAYPVADAVLCDFADI